MTCTLKHRGKQYFTTTRQYKSKTGQLKNTLMVYLDCEEREVSKLLVETCNLVVRNPQLVLSGFLRTTFIIRKTFEVGKNIYNLFQTEFLPSGRGPPQTTGLPGSCRPCRCLRCRPAPAGPERAASDTRPSLLDTGWCIARQLHHYKQKGSLGSRSTWIYLNCIDRMGK